MATIVGGVGMSHSSLVVAPTPEMWLAHDQIDRANPHLRDKHGNPVTFAQLQGLQGTNYAKESSAEYLTNQVNETIAAVKRLREDVAALRPDVIITFGDDQEEMHLPEKQPGAGGLLRGHAHDGDEHALRHL